LVDNAGRRCRSLSNKPLGSTKLRMWSARLARRSDRHSALMAKPQTIRTKRIVIKLQRLLTVPPYSNMSGWVCTSLSKIGWKCSHPMYSLPTCSRL
jgi:hypothetical protein